MIDWLLSLLCRAIGHHWQGLSLVRRCLRCGRVEIRDRRDGHWHSMAFWTRAGRPQ